MSARLTRDAQINALLPLALANGWSVREFASRARIGFADAGRLLRTVGQHSATVVDAETGAQCASLAGELRESVCGAAQALIQRLQTLAGKVESAADAERLAKALEASVRLADNLDGLAHVRALERDVVRSGEGMGTEGASRPLTFIDPFFSKLPSAP
jgi:hypothetical protein